MSSTLREDIYCSPDGGGDWVVAILATSEWGDYKLEPWAEFNLPFFGPMSEAPDGLLDMTFSDGHGAPERPSWTAWTTNYVAYGTEYDGSTASSWQDRNPKDPS